MKRTATLGIMLILTQISFAQESKLWLSLGAGMANTSSANKTNLIGNGYNIQADAFVPFYRKGWDGTVKGGSFALGVNVSGNYTAVKNLSPNNGDIASQYQIFGGNLSVASQSDAKTSGSFSGLVGLQGRISLGKFNLSPSVNTGYLNLKQEGYVQNGIAAMNAQTQQKELIKGEQEKTNGLLFKPQLKVGYDIAPNLALFVGSSLAMGPEIKHTTQYLVPQGGFNDRKMYEVSQLAKGTWESRTATSRYNIAEINFGVTMALGKKKSKARGRATLSDFSITKNIETPQNEPKKAEAQDFNTTRSNRERGQLANPDTVVNQVSNPNQPAEKSINTNNNMPSRLSMTPTTTKQSQGQTFGEKVATGLQAGANALSQGASLVGGATGSTVKSQSKEIVETPPAKAEATDFNTTRSNRERGQLMATPGQPIGGIVVKGGKNPGGNMRLVSNENGEISLPNLQKGNYLFQLNEVTPAGKSINEKGIKRTDEAAAAKPGSPIKGIIVKGGKNPGGNFINLTVNDKGQVGFEVLEAGDYKLIIQTPEAPNTETKKEKVVEKATSGLKDTLKTQV